MSLNRSHQEQRLHWIGDLHGKNGTQECCVYSTFTFDNYNPFKEVETNAYHLCILRKNYHQHHPDDWSLYYEPDLKCTPPPLHSQGCRNREAVPHP
uniref:Uncharacterized protein n=1 Tax=Magallana gigas TaxID=29159 RepID=K1R695_MAGGI